TGRKAFKRETASNTMAAIMRDEPPELSESGRNVSPALDHVVRHCLDKERENRFQSAKDVVFALSEASSSPTLTTGARFVEPPRAGNRRLIIVAAAAALLLAAAGIFLARRAPRGAGGVKRLAVLPFENQGAAEDDYFADGIA